MRPAGRIGWGVVFRGLGVVVCVVLFVAAVLAGSGEEGGLGPLPDRSGTPLATGTAGAGGLGGGVCDRPGGLGGGPAAGTNADAADAARGDAVVLTEALEGGDYVALAQAVGERVAPRVGGGAYATALVDALGARALVRVAAHLPAGGGGVTGRAGSGGSGTSSTGPGVPLACTWTSLLATATTSPLWTDDHREALARDLAALVTTTGDVAEPDTLLLPLGFRRLLTADQDPLTTAAAGTQAPGAGGGQSGTRGARDPLALDPKFLRGSSGTHHLPWWPGARTPPTPPGSPRRSHRPSTHEPGTPGT